MNRRRGHEGQRDALEAAFRPRVSNQAFLPAALSSAPVLVVVAHPDDEILGCGSLLASFGDVQVVHVTDGAPRCGQDAARHGFPDPATYAAARRREAEAALALAEVPAARLHSLDFSDQEVSLDLPGAVRLLLPWVEAAEYVLTHAFEGGHSDHDAVAFAVHAAVRGCRKPSRPILIEMPFYHAGPDGWVRQRFLPQPGAGPEWIRDLTPEELALKRRMVEAHRTQAETLRDFSLEHERFRVAPAYDFSVRPHAGPLLYERHGWNLTWTDWQARVAEAEAKLERCLA